MLEQINLPVYDWSAAKNFGMLQTKSRGYNTANKCQKLATYTLSVIQLTRN